jgi:hypothetical protein
MMKRLAFAGLLLLVGCAEGFAQTARETQNVSATITAGNTFQNILPRSSTRNSLTIQNNNASDSCWIFIGSGTASKAASILLLAGGSYQRYYPYIPADLIQATCTTTNDTLYVDVQ